MFFNLKNLKDASDQTRSPDFYIENGRETLKLKYPMVVFCDESTYDFIKNIRDNEVDSTLAPNGIQTTYIIKNITDYDYYKQNWNIINENRRLSNGYKDPTDRNTVSYFLLVMFKPLALLIAKQTIQSEYYAWIDLGCNHIVRKLSEYAPKMLDNPNPKISACYIHYRSHDEIKSMRKYMEYGGPCGMAATAFTVQENYIEKFYNSMFSIFHEMLLNQVGHTDETVMVYSYDRNPEMYTIYYGDYYSIFTNYHTIQDDRATIQHFFINECYKKNRSDLAKIAEDKLIF